MKNEKKLLALPYDNPPDIKVADHAERWKKNFLLTARVVQISDKAPPVLCLTAYKPSNGIPLWRTFIDRESLCWVSQRAKICRYTWPRDAAERLDTPPDEFIRSDAMVDNLELAYSTAYFLSDASREAIERYLPDEQSADPVQRVKHWQRGCADKRLEREHKRVIAEIDAAMAPIGPVPQHVLDWVREDVFNHSRYIFYKYEKGREAPDAYCTSCGKQVQIEGLRHNIPAGCFCGVFATAKATGRLPRNGISDSEYFVYAHRIPGGYVVRSFRAFMAHDNVTVSQADGRMIYKHYDVSCLIRLVVHETKRLVYDEKTGKTKEYMYERLYDEIRWGRPYINECLSIPQDVKAYIEELPEFTRESGRFIPVGEYWPKVGGDLKTILNRIVKYPCLEYLHKLGLTKLVEHGLSTPVMSAQGVLYPNYAGKSFRDVLGMDKCELPLLRAVNPDFRELELVRLMRSKHEPDIEEAVKTVRAEYDRKYDTVMKLLARATFHRLRRYVGEQYERRRRKEGLPAILIEWRDYLNNCEKLKYDLKSEFVIFPRDLMAAHDAAMLAVDTKKTPNTTPR